MFIQVTVGDDHTGGTWDKSVVKVYDAAIAKHASVDVQMLYAVPKSVEKSFKAKEIANVPATIPVTYCTEAAPFDFLDEDS